MILLFYIKLLLQYWELFCFLFCPVFAAHQYPSPLSVCKRGGGKVSVFFFIYVSIAKLCGLQIILPYLVLTAL